MKRSKSVVLNEPLNVGGKTIAEVVVRASTVGDEEDAMQLAVDMKRGTNPVTVEVSLLSIVTRLPYDAIRGMRGADYCATRSTRSMVPVTVARKTLRLRRRKLGCRSRPS